jgi:hypothetical protein
MMRHRGWAVPEPNKAWVWVFDLICSMIYVLLLRDLEVRPLCTPAVTLEHRRPDLCSVTTPYQVL